MNRGELAEFVCTAQYAFGTDGWKDRSSGKWKVPVEKVKAMTEEEMFKVMKSGKRKNKAWKRMITKVTFVG